MTDRIDEPAMECWGPDGMVFGLYHHGETGMPQLVWRRTDDQRMEWTVFTETQSLVLSGLCQVWKQHYAEWEAKYDV